MSKKPNTKLIGLFLFIGIICFIGLIGHVIASKTISKQDTLIVMYFDESVSGLNVGSPIVFMGVEVGKVARIDLITNPQDLSFSIPVYAKFNTKTRLRQQTDTAVTLQELIDKGLRARLTTQNYLTGQLMIELEMMPDQPVVLKETKQDILEIPTVLSPLSQLSKGIKNLPIRDSVVNLNLLLETLDKKVIPDIQTLTSNLNNLVVDNSKDITKTIYNFNETLSDISSAAKSLRNLTDYLEQHPESLIKGKKGQ